MDQQLAEIKKKSRILAFIPPAVYSIYVLVLFKMIGIDTYSPNITNGDVVIRCVWLYVPFILGILYVQKAHKKELGNYITFGRAFLEGLKFAIYACLFIAVLGTLYYTVLDVKWSQIWINAAIEDVDGNEQLLQRIEMVRPNVFFFLIYPTAHFYGLLGFVLSLVGAAVIKRVKPLHMQDEYQ